MKNLPVSANPLLRGLLALCLMLALFQACKKDEGTPVTPVDKNALKARLDSANALYNGAVEGTAIGRYEVGSKATFKTAIDAATTVNNDNNATQTAVNNANVNLGQAMTTFRSKQVAEIAPANLVLHLLMNGNANDASGKGFNGTLKAGGAQWGAGMPTPTADRFGVANMAYQFDKGGNIEIPYNSALNPSKEISISMWIKRDTTRASNYLLALNRWNGYKVQLQEANKVFFTVKTTAGAKDKDNESVTLARNKWYHIATTYKSGEMNFYIDGTLVKSWTDVTGDLAPVKSTINMTIGQDLPTSLYQNNEKDDADGNNFNGPWGGYFTGAMDDVRIYNVALSSTQITSLYNAEKSQ
ncbi:LamG domain-containing protein [Spirosoma fluminis]